MGRRLILPPTFGKAEPGRDPQRRRASRSELHQFICVKVEMHVYIKQRNLGGTELFSRDGMLYMLTYSSLILAYLSLNVPYAGYTMAYGLYWLSNNIHIHIYAT